MGQKQDRVSILALTRYSRLGPSSRYRFYQFQASLAAMGIDLTIEPLLGDWYMAALNAKHLPNPFRVLKAYLRRVWVLLHASHSDLLWIEREALPFVPWTIERALLPPVPIVLDFDDEPFQRYRAHRISLIRTLLGGKIAAAIRHATATICGNAYLLDITSRAGARSQALVPTVVDLNRYPASAILKPESDFTVGWIGTRGNVPYLDIVLGALTTLAKEAPVRILLIGAPPGTLASLHATTIDWSEETETAMLGDIDVGIMPLPDQPFERGKCGLKLIQYMASGKPTVASPVGANSSITRDGESGVLVDTETEWLTALRRLRDDPALRHRMGVAGRAAVEQNYCIDAVKTSLAAFLRQIAQSRSHDKRTP